MTFFGAIKVSNVAVALSTLSTGALFTAFLEPIFFKRKVQISEIVLAIIVSACVRLIYNASPDYWLGILLGVICCFLSALFSVCIVKIHHRFPSQKLMLYAMIECMFFF